MIIVKESKMKEELEKPIINKMKQIIPKFNKVKMTRLNISIRKKQLN